MKSDQPDLLSRLYQNWNVEGHDGQGLRALCGEAHDEIKRLRQENEKLRGAAQSLPWSGMRGNCEVCGQSVNTPTNRYMGPNVVMGGRLWHAHCFPQGGVSDTLTLGGDVHPKSGG